MARSGNSWRGPGPPVLPTPAPAGTVCEADGLSVSVSTATGVIGSVLVISGASPDVSTATAVRLVSVALNGSAGATSGACGTVTATWRYQALPASVSLAG